MNQSSLSIQSSPVLWLFSVIAVVTAAALGFYAYRRSGFRRSVLLLEASRLGLVCLAVFLLNQPETVQEFLPTEKPAVAVLGDHSLSMTTRDVGLGERASKSRGTRADKIAPLMDEATWEPVNDSVEVVLAPFATGDQRTASDLHEALGSVLKEHPNLRAVVLASDGDWNTGPAPVEMATRYRMQQIPILGFPVGSSNRLPDLDLLSFDVPTFGVVGKPIRIPFTVESSLPRDYSATVKLTATDGTELSHDVRITAMGRTSDAIVWKPESIGDYTLTLTVPEQRDEAIVDNNQRTSPIAIREEQLKVLIVESIPRWEYRFLRNALSRDPGVEVSCLLFHPELKKVGGGNRDYIRAFPEALEDLAQYDVVFLGDVGTSVGQLTEEQCRLLVGLVEQQASGLVFMPGSGGHALELAESPLDTLLPVQYDVAQHDGWGSRTPSHFALTELGRRSLLTKLADTSDANLQVWDTLPGFYWHAPVIRAKAGADVLAVHKSASNEYGRIPLLVTRTFGAGKVLFMGTDGAWRWRRGVEDLYHYRFWGQVVRWMAYQRNMAKGETMRIYYTPEHPEVRQTIALKANVMEASGEPLSSGTVTARFVAPSGRTERVQMAGFGEEWGAFSGSFRPTEPGDHRVTLRCDETGATLDATIYVQGASLEQVGKAARPEVIEELARVSRGRILDVGSIDDVVSAIANVPEPSTQTRRMQLWSHPLTALTMILLLTAFWVGRKMIGLI